MKMGMMADDYFTHILTLSLKKWNLEFSMWRVCMYLLSSGRYKLYGRTCRVRLLSRRLFLLDDE